MRLKEMIDLLRFPQRMQIRDEEGWEICACNTTSEGVLPYMNWVVTQWFGNYKDGKADFVVYVKETDDVPAEKERRMRLIDVDKFEEKNAKVWEQCGREDCYYSVGYILSQASVDAIPVEWIREQLKKEKYRTFLVDYIEWGDCLHWLIDEWEKENETD